MTADKARKRAVRARMAQTGEPYTEAARRLAEQGAGDRVAWVLLTLATVPNINGRGVDGLETADLHDLALRLSMAYCYDKPCPRVTLYQHAGGHGRAELLARLAFDRPVPVLEFDDLAEGVRLALFMRGRQAVAVTAAAAPAQLVGQLAGVVDEAGVSSPEIAEHGWHVQAWVRFLRDIKTGSPYDFEPSLYRRGEQRELIQSGRAGEPVDRSRWQTSFDVDHMHFIPADAVEVVEVLTEDSPWDEADVETPAARHARRWALCCDLFAEAAADPSTGLADWIVLHMHRKRIAHRLERRVQVLQYSLIPPVSPEDYLPAADRAEILRAVAEMVEQVVTDPAAPGAAEALAMAEELRRTDVARLADDEARALAHRAGRALERVIYTEAVAAHVTALPEGVTEEDVDAADDRLADRLIAARGAGK